ncbi:MAG: hypothetical protein AB9888_02120 [Bacteroidales bacterium]
MKKLCSTSVFAVSLLFCVNGVQAQTTETKLNQIELMKQLIGSWKCEIAKDTINYSDLKSYGTGLYGDFKYVANDKVFLEGKQLYGYDRSMDKFILSVLNKGMDMRLTAMWFTSENQCVVYYLKDISNLEKATFKVELEFKSPDIMSYKTIINNNIIRTDIFVRVND